MVINTGHRLTEVKVIARTVTTRGTLVTIVRLKDQGAAYLSDYDIPLPELNWTFSRRGDYTSILETKLNERTVR